MKFGVYGALRELESVGVYGQDIFARDCHAPTNPAGLTGRPLRSPQKHQKETSQGQSFLPATNAYPKLK